METKLAESQSKKKYVQVLTVPVPLLDKQTNKHLARMKYYNDGDGRCVEQSMEILFGGDKLETAWHSSQHNRLLVHQFTLYILFVKLDAY